MFFSKSFRQGVKAAVPVWIAFIPSSFALGMAAKGYGLRWEEIVLMSALVYAGPAQYAVVEPLAAGKPALQILIATVLMNLRFLPMSATMAPYFRGVKRTRLLWASHFISASSFVLPYVRFQKEEKEAASTGTAAQTGDDNLSFFLGIGMTAFCVWVAGTAVGYWAALSMPPGFEEVLKFILPAYFACILAIDLRERMAAAVCILCFVAAVPAALWNTDWGWMITAIAIATVVWRIEEWRRPA
ncbi:MAG TPA: AzlC family ABC transporter permease [Candidatus Binatia bacterium]|jgi:predicted branched-subunit amino acid permease